MKNKQNVIIAIIIAVLIVIIGVTALLNKDNAASKTELNNDAVFAIIENGVTPNWQHISNFNPSDLIVFTKEYNSKKYGSVTLDLPSEGVFSLKSDSTEFAAYSYGFSQYESYGFPTSSATKDITVIDTKAPDPTYVESDDTENPGFAGMVSDMPDNGKDRTNLSDVHLLENLNDNFTFEYSDPSNNKSEFIPGQQRMLSWSLTVKNKDDSASATIYFLDRAGNDTTITLNYSPEVILEKDSDSPVPTYVQECDGGIAKGMGSVSDMPENDDIRSNLEALVLIENLNDNYMLDYSVPDSDSKDFVPGEERTLDWWLTVVDKTQPASATIMFKDGADNDTTITIDYNPAMYDIAGSTTADAVDVGGDIVTMQDTIKNLSAENALYITRVELQKGDQGFSIVGYEPESWSPGMAIAKGSEVIVNLEFDPTNADAEVTYTDSLGIGYGDDKFAECGFTFLSEKMIDTRTSSIEQLPNSQYSLYPNPTKNSITISLETNGSIDRYQIFDIDGKPQLIGEGSSTAKQTINIESLPAGVYMIELITAKNKYVRDKFIKE